MTQTPVNDSNFIGVVVCYLRFVVEVGVQLFIRTKISFTEVGWVCGMFIEKNIFRIFRFLLLTYI